MSPYTGKGASLAFTDAMALGKILDTDAFYTSPEAKATLMEGFVDDMLKRRKKQREGGVFIQRVVFSGKNVIKAAARDNLFRCYNVWDIVWKDCRNLLLRRRRSLSRTNHEQFPIYNKPCISSQLYNIPDDLLR
jgi:2-polyprenyl-6-methoxyphenol hydroxylase-like FAD-dependent oxidoreductase